MVYPYQEDRVVITLILPVRESAVSPESDERACLFFRIGDTFFNA